MAKAIPDYAIEVRDVSDEIAALREAVEVLEAMESEARIGAQVVTSARDYYLKNWKAQRDECARLSGQVRIAQDDAAKARASRDYASAQLERQRGMENDETGSYISGLVRDGYGVSCPAVTSWQRGGCGYCR